MWCTFYFQLHFHCHSLYCFIKTDTLVFCNFFRIFSITFGWKSGWRKQNFSNSEDSASEHCLGFAYFLFCQFLPGVAYKSVDYKKKTCIEIYKENCSVGDQKMMKNRTSISFIKVFKWLIFKIEKDDLTSKYTFMWKRMPITKFYNSV